MSAFNDMYTLDPGVTSSQDPEIYTCCKIKSNCFMAGSLILLAYFSPIKLTVPVPGTADHGSYK
jgi:hypothetical protein